MVQKAENMTSMRRNKVIADSKDKKDASSLASSQIDKLDEISSKLDNQQASSELIADVIETKANTLNDTISGLDDSIKDVTAGTEITAEAVEESNKSIKELNSTASKISEKISKLAELLGQKVEASNKITQPAATSAQAIEEAIPVKIIPESVPEAEKLLPAVVDNEPDAEFLPQVTPEENKQDEDQKKKDSKLLSGILTATDVGFKKSLSVSDRIAGMLFQYTITAAIQAAKMAALIFGIVLGIDLLVIHFKYWSEKFSMSWDLFNKDFTEFSKETGAWGPLLRSIFEAAEGIKLAWENQDWLGLAGAIVTGLVDVMYNLGELIQVGLAKLTASILRLIPGAGETADNIEGRALEGFQKRTGADLNDEDQEKVINYQSRKIEEGEGIFDKIDQGKTWFVNKLTGQEDNSDFIKSDEKKAELEMLKKMPEDQRKAVLKQQLEADSTLTRLDKFVDGANLDKKGTAESLSKAMDDVRAKVASPELEKSPVVKKELQDRLDKIEAKYKEKTNKAKVEAESSTKSNESQQVKQIESNQAQKEVAKEAAKQAILNNTNNVVNNSKTIHNMNPVTSTSSPGIFGSVGVN